MCHVAGAQMGLTELAYVTRAMIEQLPLDLRFSLRMEQQFSFNQGIFRQEEVMRVSMKAGVRHRRPGS